MTRTMKGFVMDKSVRIFSLCVCWFAMLVCPVAAVYAVRDHDPVAGYIMLFATSLAAGMQRHLAHLGARL